MFTRHDVNQQTLAAALISLPTTADFVNSFWPFLSHLSLACGAFIGIVNAAHIIKRWWKSRK